MFFIACIFTQLVLRNVIQVRNGAQRERDIPKTSIFPNNETSLSNIRRYMFIHIPKTGGSSIESEKWSNCILKRHLEVPPLNFWSASSNWSSPWHFPPDLYELRYNQPFNIKYAEKRFCVVRNPIDRFASCVSWSVHHWHTPLTHLLHTYLNRTSPLIHWNEELLHRMPQHMFVWDTHGEVQCHCVVAFEKLSNLTSITRNKSPAHTQKDSLPNGFHDLYAMDFLLWEDAIASKDLCYTPKQQAAST